MAKPWRDDCASQGTGRAERLVVGLLIRWKKLAPEGRNANEVTRQRLTGLGRCATFYDRLVQVEAA
ncbi:hypothetical protein IHE31_05355 [Mycetohabitans rhizoxinica]|uniref:hypothetical protein n=1 Tax=Mycetohabitans rhizoxinica TaxID=412963 RepID=UPI0032531C68